MTVDSLVSPIGGVVTHVRQRDGVFFASAGRGLHPEQTPPLVGVGVSEDDAVCRALELYAATAWDAKAMRWASADELGDEALPVEELARIAPLELRDRIRWVEGFALDDGRPIFVPAVLVHLGLPVAVEPEAFWPASLAGLAADYGLGAAVLRGLLDLVARDACALAGARAAQLPRVAVSAEAASVFESTSDLGIPCAFACSSDSDAFGVGAGGTIEAASADAVADMARRGARTATDLYPRVEEWVFKPTLEGDVAPLEARAPIDLSKPTLLAHLRRVAVSGYAVDVTTDELERIGLSAVRVVVPGLSPIAPTVGWTDHARLARVVP